MKTKAIVSANIKTDKLDAKIAHPVRGNLVAESCVRHAKLKEGCTGKV